MRLAVEAGRGDGGARRVGARPAREPLLRHGPARVGGAKLPRGARTLSRLRARGGRARRGGCGARPLRPAARLYGRAVAKLPLPQYEASLGDVLGLAGRDAEADNAYAVVDATEKLLGRTASGRSSRPLSSTSTTAETPPPRSPARADAYRERKSSTATTSSPGRSTRTGAAAKRSRTRAARFDSGRTTR